MWRPCVAALKLVPIPQALGATFKAANGWRPWRPCVAALNLARPEWARSGLFQDHLDLDRFALAEDVQGHPIPDQVSRRTRPRKSSIVPSIPFPFSPTITSPAI